MTTDPLDHGHGDFQPGAVRVVDYNTANNNILVRGCSAMGATGFLKIGSLITAITSDVNFKATGITLADNPLVIDFCLIGFGSGSKDERIVRAEVNWFNPAAPTPNGNSGPYPTYIPGVTLHANNYLVYWPAQSIGGIPPEVPGGTWNPLPTHQIEPGGPGDYRFNFAGLIPAIRNALTNNVSLLPPGFPVGTIKNAIIYFHCDSGVNRTGAVAASYLMMYGSDVSALKLPRNKSATPYTLQHGQTAANLAPPSDDTNPHGGSDIPIASAYCNFVLTQGFASLQANCVPLPGTIWP